MKNIRKIIVFILFSVIIILLDSCIDNCPSRLIEVDNIPDSVLNLIPYQNNEIVTLKHQNGKIINFLTERNINEIYLQDNDCECCDSYKFQELNVRLIPDFPLFEINFKISYMNPEIYQENFYFNIGNTYFNTYYQEPEIIDTLEINSIKYSDVMILPNNYGNYSENEIYIDTVLYNYENGIIKILMSNEEFYEISE